jgi:type I restriction enzyme S subunit
LNIASPGGAGRNKTLGQEEFNKLKFPVPPVQHQQLTVDVMSTWDRAISATQNVIALKRAIKKWLNRNLLNGDFRLPGFGAASVKKASGPATACGHIPSDWKTVRFGSLGSTYSGLSGKSKEDFGTGSPYIPYLNIFNNAIIDEKHLDYVQVGPDERQNEVRKGDLFFTTSSETPEEVGMASVFLMTLERAYLNSFCFGFRLHDFDSLWPEFAGHLLRGEHARRSIARLSQGATRYNLPRSAVLNLHIPVPSLEEQKSIAAVLSAADREVKLLQRKLAALQEQKKALMQQLLSGKPHNRTSAKNGGKS